MAIDDAPTPSRSEVTRVLASLRDVEDSTTARNRLYSLVYDELRGMAAGLMRSERPGHTLRPTALVHEAYFKLVGADSDSWETRAHFFGAAARAMREVLVEHARRHTAAKRGGGRHRVTLTEAISATTPIELEVLVVDDAVSKLSRLDERTGRVAELRIFAGLPMKEIARILGVSKRTAEGDWSFAQKWLGRVLG